MALVQLVPRTQGGFPCARGGRATERRRQIRCNRARPCCDKCAALDVSCVFPARKQRSKRAPASADEAFKNIFERLERIENTLADLKAGRALDDAIEPEYGSRLPSGSESPRAAASNPASRDRTASVGPSVVVEKRDEACSPTSLTQLVSEATTLARAMLNVNIKVAEQQSESVVLENLDKVVTEAVSAGRSVTYNQCEEQFLLPSKADSRKWLACECALAAPVASLTAGSVFRNVPRVPHLRHPVGHSHRLFEDDSGPA